MLRTQREGKEREEDERGEQKIAKEVGWGGGGGGGKDNELVSLTRVYLVTGTGVKLCKIVPGSK